MKKTLEEIDDIIKQFNKTNSSSFIRVSTDYKNVNTPIIIKNLVNNQEFKVKVKLLNKGINKKVNYISLKKCSHHQCGYDSCILDNIDLEKLKEIYINSNNLQDDIANYLNINKTWSNHLIKDLKLSENYKDLRYERIYNEPYCFNPFENMDANSWWLFGYLLADGSMGIRAKRIKKSINVSSIDRELIEHCCNIFKLPYTEIKEKLNLKKSNNAIYSIDISDNNICDNLLKLGLNPNKSYKGTEKLTIDDNYKFDFLRGYFDGNGCASKGVFSICGNPRIIEEIYKHFPSLTYTSSKKSKYVAFLSCYSLPKNLWLYNKMYYKDDLPCLTRKKLKLYNNIKHLKLDKVKSLEYTNEPISVCDLSVKGSHSFFANNIFVHNCDFSAEELRVAALWSKEPAWLNAFVHGKDIHKSTAEIIWRRRKLH